MLYRKLRQYSHISYNGAEILACHGGIPNLDTNLLFIPTIYLIDGVGEYGDVELNAESWMTQTGPLTYLVHGHRNPGSVETQMENRVFNLDGHVEFGGKLRIVEVDKQLHWNVVELEDCQEITEDLDTTERNIETVEDAVRYLRNNSLVEEKQFGNISSFNFSREAFTSRRWNKQTIL